MISFSPKAKYNQEAAVVLLTSSQTDKRLKRELEKGEVFPVLEGKTLLLFVGLGKADKLSLTDVRIQVRRALLSSFLKKIKNIELVPHTKDEAAIKAMIEGIGIG